MVEKQRKGGMFYGWFVVFAAFMTQFTVYSLVYNCFGLFILPVSEALSVSRTAVSTFYTILSITALLVTIFPISQLLDHPHIDVKWVMAAGCIFVGMGFIGASKVTTINQFYIMAIFIGIGLAASATGAPLAIAINSWFIEKRGLALGVAMAGSGVGSVILTQLITRVLATYNWSRAFLMVGIITIVGTVPLVLAFVTKFPEKKGLTAYGSKKKQGDKGKEVEFTQEQLEEMSVGNSVKSKRFWLFFFGFAAQSFAMPAVKILLSPYLQDLNFTEQFVGNVLSLTAIVLIPGKPLVGHIFEKWGSRMGMLISGGFMTISIFMLLTNTVPLIYLFGIIYGLGSSVASVGPPLFISELFEGNPNYAILMTLASIGGGISGSLGSTVLTGVQESTGSYILPWLVIAGCLGLATILIILSVTVSKREVN